MKVCRINSVVTKFERLTCIFKEILAFEFIDQLQIRKTLTLPILCINKHTSQTHYINKKKAMRTTNAKKPTVEIA